MRSKRDGNAKGLGIVLLRESNSKKEKVYLSLVSARRVDAVHVHMLVALRRALLHSYTHTLPIHLSCTHHSSPLTFDHPIPIAPPPPPPLLSAAARREDLRRGIESASSAAYRSAAA